MKNVVDFVNDGGYRGFFLISYSRNLQISFIFCKKKLKLKSFKTKVLQLINHQ